MAIEDKTIKFVKDWMNNDFKMIQGTINPLESIALLENSSYGVIENTSQQAIGAVTKADLEGATATNESNPVQQLLYKVPLLKVGCDVEMLTIETSVQLATLIKISKAAIVTDDANQIVGVLSAESVRQFIQSSTSQQKGAVLGSDALPYVPGTGLKGALSPLTAYCICYECWYVNELSAEQWKSLQANPLPPIT